MRFFQLMENMEFEIPDSWWIDSKALSTLNQHYANQ